MAELEPKNEARERVLDAAERLFAQKGYSAVTLRDIAAEVGIRHTSLYHHVPGGKEELFIEVTERNLDRHRNGLAEAVAGSEANIRARLCAVADWLLSQPPMDLVRMVYSDMPAIDQAQAFRLSELAYTSILVPLEIELIQARTRGEIDHPNLGLVAGGLLGMLEGLHAIPDYALTESRQTMAYQLIDVMLDGLRPAKL
ncbi:MAG TPA: helix-turn-helix domain-containing protein [Anaerolineae bacterium]|nr:helix-turn-helix domain-containing protein [Anaerolineae bacterium]HMR67739.1 helix-turn-helix domain-containing protein [Anaerolineae bacterium]